MNNCRQPHIIMTELESTKVTAIENTLAPQTLHLLC
jgi:hypothetical protein